MMSVCNQSAGQPSTPSSAKPTPTVGRRLRLRRPNHSNDLSSLLSASLRDESFTDASLICENHTIKVHRVVLSLFSPFFRQTFLSLQTSNVCHFPCVVIKNLPYVDLKAIIEFVYSGEVSIPKEQLNSLLKSATDLEIEGLQSNNCAIAPSVDVSQLNHNFSHASGDNVNVLPAIPAKMPIRLNKSSAPLSAIEFRPSPPKRLRLSQNNAVVSRPKNNAKISFIQPNTHLSIVQLVPVHHGNGVNAKNYSKNSPKSSNTPKAIANAAQPNKPQTILAPKLAVILPVEPQTQRLPTAVASNSNATQIPISLPGINPELTVTYTPASATSVYNAVDLTYMYEISDDSERIAFLDKLRNLYKKFSAPVIPCPTLNKMPVDFYRLYLEVKERGDYNAIKDQQWVEIAESCKFASNNQNALALKLCYDKHLQPFIEHIDSDSVAAVCDRNETESDPISEGKNEKEILVNDKNEKKDENIEKNEKSESTNNIEKESENKVVNQNNENNETNWKECESEETNQKKDENKDTNQNKEECNEKIQKKSEINGENNKQIEKNEANKLTTTITPQNTATETAVISNNNHTTASAKNDSRVIEEIWIDDDVEAPESSETITAAEPEITALYDSFSQKSKRSPFHPSSSSHRPHNTFAAKSVKCQLCFKSFPNEIFLNNHRSSFHKSMIKCGDCDREFANNHLYQMHIKSNYCRNH